MTPKKETTSSAQQEVGSDEDKVDSDYVYI